MARRHIKPISDDVSASLPTERLLTYRKALRALEDSGTTSDISEAESRTLDPNLIYFKDDPAWEQLYAHVKTVLADREHVN